jgi:hypothetical protein
MGKDIKSRKNPYINSQFILDKNTKNTHPGKIVSKKLGCGNWTFTCMKMNSSHT